MLASLLLLSLCLFLSVFVPSVVAQTATTQFGFCFTNTNKPGSPYGPWSVATSGVLTVNSTLYFVTKQPTTGGGQRYGYDVLSATGSRTQLNRDGSTSSATLGLCPNGKQGSDNVVYNSSSPTWLDWDGICFSVVTSTDTPFQGSGNWIVYPNDFPTQQVEIYYDLPVLSYPSEYHTDNSTNGVLTIVPGGTAPTCTPAPLSGLGTMQTTALTYQFCYQAYAAASGSTPAWQVAIQGTFLTAPNSSTSTISGKCGLFIYTVSGTRTQSVGGTQSSVYVAGQTYHNSGTTIVDLNEYKDDPLLQQSAPFLVPNYGFVLYTNTNFTYPNGVAQTINNQYAQVPADPLWVGGSNSVYEQDGPTPDWSNFAVSCGCSVMSCPLITSSSNAASSSSATSTCNAISQGTTLTPSTVCSTAKGNYNGSYSCSNNGAAHTTLSTLALLLALTTLAAAMLL